jgi:hypothetical protein
VRCALVCFALSLLACGENDVPRDDPRPSPTVEPSPTPPRVSPPDDPLRDPAVPFRFRVIDFNWEVQGSEVTDIRSDGTSQYTFYAGRTEPGAGTTIYWRQADLAVAPDDLATLRRLLVEDFRPLERSYVDETIADGAQTDYEVTVAGQTQRVHCGNEYPIGIRRIGRFLGERIRAPNQAAIDAAPEITEEQARAAGALH